MPATPFQNSSSCSACFRDKQENKGLSQHRLLYSKQVNQDLSFLNKSWQLSPVQASFVFICLRDFESQLIIHFLLLHDPYGQTLIPQQQALSLTPLKKISYIYPV